MHARKGNLCILGTSHIAQQSVNEVQKLILEEKPAIVALELDPKRFTALMSPKRKLRFRDIRHLGIRGFLFNSIGAAVEKRLGKLVNTPPGSEIKKAVECARSVQARVALIDRDISITLKRLTKALTLKEKLRFLKEVALAMFHRKSSIKFDLRKVPDEQLIKKLTGDVRKKYPSVYKVLIDERDEYMAKALNKMLHDYADAKVVAIVGAGHVNGIKKRIKEQ